MTFRLTNEESRELDTYRIKTLHDKHGIYGFRLGNEHGNLLNPCIILRKDKLPEWNNLHASQSLSLQYLNSKIIKYSDFKNTYEAKLFSLYSTYISNKITESKEKIRIRNGYLAKMIKIYNWTFSKMEPIIDKDILKIARRYSCEFRYFVYALLVKYPNMIPIVTKYPIIISILIHTNSNYRYITMRTLISSTHNYLLKDILNTKHTNHRQLLINILFDACNKESHDIDNIKSIIYRYAILTYPKYELTCFDIHGISHISPRMIDTDFAILTTAAPKITNCTELHKKIMLLLSPPSVASPLQLPVIWQTNSDTHDKIEKYEYIDYIVKATRIIYKYKNAFKPTKTMTRALLMRYAISNLFTHTDVTELYKNIPEYIKKFQRTHR